MLAIRSYRSSDLDALYEICLRTGAAGEDATTMVDDPRLFGELFAAPYGVLEPEHAFVLDDGTGRAVAYVLGALDTRAFEERCEADWWPALRVRYPIGLGRRRLDELLVGILHDPPRAADRVVKDYPSHLHIDLLPEAQGGGWGRSLTETLLDALRVAGSVGAHLGVNVANHRAVGFYEHLGFVELAQNATTRTLGKRL